MNHFINIGPIEEIIWSWQGFYLYASICYDFNIDAEIKAGSISLQSRDKLWAKYEPYWAKAKMICSEKVISGGQTDERTMITLERPQSGALIKNALHNACYSLC